MKTNEITAFQANSVTLESAAASIAGNYSHQNLEQAEPCGTVRSTSDNDLTTGIEKNACSKDSAPVNAMGDVTDDMGSVTITPTDLTEIKLLDEVPEGTSQIGTVEDKQLDNPKEDNSSDETDSDRVTIKNSEEYQRFLDDIKTVASLSEYNFPDEGIGIAGGFYIDCDGIHTIANGKHWELIANFAVFPIIARRMLGDVPTSEVELLILTKDTKVIASISYCEFHSVKWMDRVLGLRFSVYKGHDKNFVKYLQNLTPYVNEVLVQTAPGWCTNKCYVHSGGVIGDTGEGFVVGENLSKAVSFPSNAKLDKSAFTKVLGTLIKCTKSCAAKILFCFAVLSFMTSVFRAKNMLHSPQFSVFLVGKSGSRKTSLANAVLSFSPNIQKYDFSVGITDRSLVEEVKISRDCVFLADDLVDNTDPRAVGTLDMIVRMAGNAGSERKVKGRSDGMCTLPIMTGEVLPNVARSSLNRMLVIDLTDDVDLTTLSEMQTDESKALYAEAVYGLLSWISQMGADAFVNKLYDNFTIFVKKLTYGKSGLCHRRVEAYAWLLAAEECLKEYEPSAFDDDVTEPLLQYASTALDNDKVAQLYDSDEYVFCSYVYDNRSALFRRENVATKNAASATFGYIDDRYIYILNSALDPLLKKAGVSESNSYSLLKELKKDMILLPEANRGFKYRYPGTRGANQCITVRLSIHKLKSFVGIIDEEECL